ncbi:RNA-directed DNA polymerase [Malassezia cuniculi]|uniref:Telomerase reverse transcriptase n=1 Tax=Malassezia cuniculi TaxID=948313 RepID=A0AAF0EXK5_9BASI|nr:RNA-directed DNA polymerase [Malassezia cuniculi]
MSQAIEFLTQRTSSLTVPERFRSLRETRLASVRPMSEFLDYHRVSRPRDTNEAIQRITYNTRHFATNYTIVILVLSVYGLVTAPLLLVAMGVLFGGFVAINRFAPEPMQVGEHVITQKGLYAALLVVGLVLLWFAQPFALIFWIVSSSALLILFHAAFIEPPVSSEYAGIETVYVTDERGADKCASCVREALFPLYYEHVLSLADYVTRACSDAGASESRPYFPDAQLGVVDQVVAGELRTAAPLAVPDHIPRWMAPMLEEGLSADAYIVTIRHAQAALIDMRHAGVRNGDVLTAGCRRNNSTSSSMRPGDAQLTAVYPNTTLTTLTLSSEWYNTFLFLGPQRFYRMLLTTACFVPLAGDCYMQLWGPPITEAVPRAGAKRGGATGALFSRFRLYYARPWRAYRRGIILGLTPLHALNELRPTDEGAAQLCKQIWHMDASISSRLAAAHSLVRAMLHRHRRTSYEMLLSVCCPPPPRAAQVINNATPFGRVCWFVGAVLRRVVPLPLFGSVHNRRVILLSARRLIKARRYEQSSLHDAMQGFRVNDCEWARAPGRAAQNQRATAAEQQKRTQLVSAWVFWLFEELVIPLLRTTFYATESHSTRLRTLYFRHDVWDELCAGHLERLGAQIFMPSTGDKSQASRLRLVPKGESMRPIINLRRSGAASANAKMQVSFELLNSFRKTHPHFWGASIGDAHGVYERLKQAKAALQVDGRLPQLFLVKSDVRAAFDSLSHDTLLALLNNLLRTESRELLVQRFTALRQTWDSVRRDVVRRTLPDGEYPSFPETASREAERASHAVFVDSVAYMLTDTERALRQLEAHVTAHDVMLGRRIHRQVTGVPQGSVVATMLCNLMLADAERTYLSDALAHGHLLRWTDDFLYITPSLAHAEQFCRALAHGFDKHGCEIALEKTLVNFDTILPNGHVVPRIAPGERLPWCGYAISPTDLSVRADVSRLPPSVRDTLTVGSHASPGNVLLSRVLAAVRQRIHALFTDTVLNPVRVAYANVFDCFVIAATRMHAHAHALRGVRANFLVHVTQSAIRHAYPIIAKRASAQRPPGCRLQRTHIEWLGWFAFWTVARRQHANTLLTQTAYRKMMMPRYAQPRTRLGPLAVRAWRRINCNDGND